MSVVPVSDPRCPPPAARIHVGSRFATTLSAARVTASRNGLPRGRAKLVALEVAAELSGEIHRMRIPSGLDHPRDHVVRAADNAMLRLSEANGRTHGNRTQHLEAAYAEDQEVQSDLLLLVGRGVRVPAAVRALADRVGGLVYGLLWAESRR